MGWFYEKAKHYKNRKVDILEEVKSMLGDEGVLKVELVDDVVYAAVENVDEDGSKSVEALVFLTDVSGREFGHKLLPEFMGPAAADCPESILSLLTPTEQPFANEWRERCWANVKRRKQRELESSK